MANQLKIIKNKLNLIIIVLILVFIAMLFGLLNFLENYGYDYNNNSTIVIAGQEIKIQVARTYDQKSLGLGGRKSLPKNQGMIFVYDEYIIPKFWMKGMEFPLDIIWIKDSMVTGWEKNLPPPGNNSDLPLYQPRTFINYVLEVNAGFVDQYGLKIGDKVEIRI